MVNALEEEKYRNHHLRRIRNLAILDVQKGLNSTKWSSMMRVLQYTFKINSYLLCIINNYLKDRAFQYETYATKKWEWRYPEILF